MTNKSNYRRIQHKLLRRFGIFVLSSIVILIVCAVTYIFTDWYWLGVFNDFLAVVLPFTMTLFLVVNYVLYAEDSKLSEKEERMDKEEFRRVSNELVELNKEKGLPYKHLEVPEDWKPFNHKKARRESFFLMLVALVFNLLVLGWNFYGFTQYFF